MALSDDQVVELLTGIKQDLGEMKGKLDATIDAHEIRMQTIEETVNTNDRRQWIVSACVIPIVSTLHYMANKFGIRV